MPAWSSSSLAVSDNSHELTRHSSGLLKRNGGRHSKQHMVEKKMFGSRIGKHGIDFQIGKKFRGFGKKRSGYSIDNMKSSSISPDPVEFEKMLKSSVTNNPNKKKSLFSRKQIG